MINSKTWDCGEKFTEAWLSCMIMMVQGDLTAWTFKHAVTALKTSTAAVLAYAACMLVFSKENKALNILLIGVLTAIFDYEVHPSHFGEHYSEAIATGISTSAMALIVYLIKRINKKKN
jgi:H+/gluconate symporter-like permease|tara:strand:+ start:282 stop:638 length:357 start_codon:yes stop_codon:yes gene_type:complete